MNVASGAASSVSALAVAGHSPAVFFLVSHPYGGTSVLMELLHMIVRSGLEPLAFVQNWVTNSGVRPDSGLVTELRVHMHTMYLVFCVDGLNAGALALAEHVARRMMQQFKAVRRNPKQSDYAGLATYTEHLPDSAS